MGNGAKLDRGTPNDRRTALRQACCAIESLEPRRLLSVTPSIPNDPYLDYHFSKIDMPLAWGITKGSDEVIIAVLDTGIDLRHPDLAAHIFTNPNEIPGNGIDDDGNGFVDDVHGWDFAGHDNDPSDLQGHGTHVAGTIGAIGNNGIGTSGIAQNVKILPVKVLGDTGTGSNDSILEGIRYITTMKRAGYNIVAANASLGGYPFPAPASWELAIREMTDAGVLFVVAAGNEGADIGGVSPLPVKFALNNPNILTVAATDQNDQLAGFSNYNQAVVHVAAPGVDITSTWPTHLYFDDNGLPLVPGGGYHTISGTSMATPVVSGIVALLASHRPNASITELKDAILKGAERVPSLSPLYSRPGKVQTAGRVNAYYSLLALDNTLAGQDSFTRGNWTGVYGTGGYYLTGDTANLPADLSFNVIDAFGLPVRVGANNLSGLTSIHAPGTRTITHLATAGTMKLDFNFADDQTHYVTLYMADVERQNRAQVVELVHVDANRRMDGTLVTNFQDGQYITFKVQGHDQIWVTNVAPGKTAVVDAVFIDSVPTNPKTHISTDTTTAGAWRRHYGSQGALIAGQTMIPPAFASVTVNNAEPVVRQARTPDPRALERIGDTLGIQAYYQTADAMSVDIAFNDAQPHKITVHMADYERAGRVQRVDLYDRATGNLLDSRVVGGFSQGTYLTWQVESDVRLVVSRINGPSAVISGLFFDAATTADVQYAGIDATTNGNWRGIYGNQSALIPGDTVAYPSFFGPVDGIWFGRVVNGISFDPRAPQTVNGPFGARTASYFATSSQMTFNFDFGQANSRRVALYLADYERLNRSQRIEVIDPDSGAILASQDVSGFADKGKYVTFEITGKAQIRVTRLGGPTAIVSGIFVG